jgi:hypothetical protein
LNLKEQTMQVDKLSELLRRTAESIPVDDHPDLDAIHALTHSERRRRTARRAVVAVMVAAVLGVGIAAIAQHRTPSTEVHAAANGATTVPDPTNAPTTISPSTAPPTTIHMPCARSGPGNANAPHYIGLTLERARTRAASQGHPLLIIDVDGRRLPFELDRLIGRVNVVVVNNVVKQACHE